MNLASAYAGAFEEWGEESAIWDVVVGDGLDQEPGPPTRRDHLAL